MGVKAWILAYADGDVSPVLRTWPSLDIDASRSHAARLYPGCRLTEVEGFDLYSYVDDGYVTVGSFPHLALVSTRKLAVDRPSELDRRYLDAADGRTVYLCVMYSVVDWLAYAVWVDGTLTRSFNDWVPDWVRGSLG